MRQRRWLLIGLVVGVAALIHLVVLPRSEAWGGRNWRELLMFSMAPSHGTLLALWTALGGRATPWRFVGAFVGVVAWICILGGSPWMSWAFVLLVQMVAMSGVLLLARLLGLELADDFRRDSSGDAVAEGPWVQYSVRSLLLWTAACAAVLGTLHYLPKESFSDFSDEPVILATMIGTSVVTASGALWIGFGARWEAVPILGLGLTAVTGVATVGLLVGSRGDLWKCVAFCLFQAAYLVGSFWLIRLAGYRLAWRRRIRL